MQSKLGLNDRAGLVVHIFCKEHSLFTVCRSGEEFGKRTLAANAV